MRNWFGFSRSSSSESGSSESGSWVPVMKRTASWRILVLGLAFCLGGCAGSGAELGVRPSADALRRLLNSERIEAVFGSFGIEVLEADRQTRVSNLYSLHGRRRICRTFAMVTFAGRGSADGQHVAAIESAHERILAGGSIGATLQRAGWSVGKRHVFFGEIEADLAFARAARLMDELLPNTLAVHIYVLEASKGKTTLDYATIAEVHHPDFLTLADLRALYGAEVWANTETSAAIDSTLRSVRAALVTD